MTTSPYIISTHDLSRAPGSMRQITRELPTPTDVGTQVIAVSPGAPLSLDIRLQAVSEGIFVDGAVSATAQAQCVRCLLQVDSELVVDLAELYLYPGGRERALADGDEDAEDLRELDGELLDLEPALRDALVLAMPFRPLCTPDCPGLCPECGLRLADAPAGHSHEVLDPRWAQLAALAGTEAGSPDAGTPPTDGDATGDATADGTSGGIGDEGAEA